MGYTKGTMSECAIPRNFETYVHIPNAAGRFDEGLSVAGKIGNGRRIVAKSRSCSIKISPLIASIHFRSDPTTCTTCGGCYGEKNRKRICFYVGWSAAVRRGERSFNI